MSTASLSSCSTLNEMTQNSMVSQSEEDYLRTGKECKKLEE